MRKVFARVESWPRGVEGAADGGAAGWDLGGGGG